MALKSASSARQHEQRSAGSALVVRKGATTFAMPVSREVLLAMFVASVPSLAMFVPTQICEASP